MIFINYSKMPYMPDVTYAITTVAHRNVPRTVPWIMVTHLIYLAHHVRKYPRHDSAVNMLPVNAVLKSLQHTIPYLVNKPDCAHMVERRNLRKFDL